MLDKLTSCEYTTLAVTLKVVNGGDCPFDPITLRCIVQKKPQTSFLSWKCSENIEQFVICNPIVAFNCEFGRLTNITGSCECGGSIIVSEATFLANSNSARSLICSDGVQQDEVSITPRGMGGVE